MTACSSIVRWAASGEMEPWDGSGRATEEERRELRRLRRDYYRDVKLFTAGKPGRSWPRAAARQHPVRAQRHRVRFGRARESHRKGFLRHASSCAFRAVIGLGLALTFVLAVPSAASAHGVDEGAKSIPEFVWLGVTHMLLGWDHLLFVAGVALIAAQIRRAAGLITLFALGHSVTLIAASIAEWRISPVKVDLVIALSVVLVGVVALFARPKTTTHWRLFAAAVLGFGLIHGLGLSTRLQDIDVHGIGSLGRIIAFNVGIELGQVLALIVVMVIASYLPAKLTSDTAQRAASVGIIVLGFLVAGLVLLDRANRPDPLPAAAADKAGPCTSGERQDTLPYGQGGHPSKDFYEPTETAPLKDFGHVIGDGYVIVQYQPTMPADKVAELRTYITSPAGGKVSGGPRPEQTALLTATHVRGTLTCSALDLAALEQFVRTWFADPRSKVGE